MDSELEEGEIDENEEVGGKTAKDFMGSPPSPFRKFSKHAHGHKAYKGHVSHEERASGRSRRKRSRHECTRTRRESLSPLRNYRRRSRHGPVSGRWRSVEKRPRRSDSRSVSASTSSNQRNCLHHRNTSSMRPDISHAKNTRSSSNEPYRRRGKTETLRVRNSGNSADRAAQPSRRRKKQRVETTVTLSAVDGMPVVTTREIGAGKSASPLPRSLSTESVLILSPEPKAPFSPELIELHSSDDEDKASADGKESEDASTDCGAEELELRRVALEGLFNNLQRQEAKKNEVADEELDELRNRLLLDLATRNSKVVGAPSCDQAVPVASLDTPPPNPATSTHASSANADVSQPEITLLPKVPEFHTSSPECSSGEHLRGVMSKYRPLSPTPPSEKTPLSTATAVPTAPPAEKGISTHSAPCTRDEPPILCGLWTNSRQEMAEAVLNVAGADSERSRTTCAPPPPTVTFLRESVLGRLPKGVPLKEVPREQEYARRVHVLPAVMSPQFRPSRNTQYPRLSIENPQRAPLPTQHALPSPVRYPASEKNLGNSVRFLHSPNFAHLFRPTDPKTKHEHLRALTPTTAHFTKDPVGINALHDSVVSVLPVRIRRRLVGGNGFREKSGARVGQSPSAANLLSLQSTDSPLPSPSSLPDLRNNLNARHSVHATPEGPISPDEQSPLHRIDQVVTGGLPLKQRHVSASALREDRVRRGEGLFVQGGAATLDKHVAGRAKENTPMSTKRQAARVEENVSDPPPATRGNQPERSHSIVTTPSHGGQHSSLREPSHTSANIQPFLMSASAHSRKELATNAAVTPPLGAPSTSTSVSIEGKKEATGPSGQETIGAGRITAELPEELTRSAPQLSGIPTIATAKALPLGAYPAAHNPPPQQATSSDTPACSSAGPKPRLQQPPGTTPSAQLPSNMPDNPFLGGARSSPQIQSTTDVGPPTAPFPRPSNPAAQASNQGTSCRKEDERSSGVGGSPSGTPAPLASYTAAYLESLQRSKGNSFAKKPAQPKAPMNFKRTLSQKPINKIVIPLGEDSSSEEEEAERRISSAKTPLAAPLSVALPPNFDMALNAMLKSARETVEAKGGKSVAPMSSDEIIQASLLELLGRRSGNALGTAASSSEELSERLPSSAPPTETEAARRREELELREKLLKATLMKKMDKSQLKLQLAATENKLIRTRSTATDMFLKLHSSMANYKEKRIYFRQLYREVEKLRTELEAAVKRMRITKKSATLLAGEVRHFSKLSFAMRNKCIDLSKSCSQLGTQFAGPRYKMPTAGEGLLKEMVNQVRRQSSSMKNFNEKNKGPGSAPRRPPSLRPSSPLRPPAAGTPPTASKRLPGGAQASNQAGARKPPYQIDVAPTKETTENRRVLTDVHFEDVLTLEGEMGRVSEEGTFAPLEGALGGAWSSSHPPVPANAEPP